MTVVELIVYLIVGGVCGAIARAVAGGTPGGFVVSMLVGVTGGARIESDRSALSTFALRKRGPLQAGVAIAVGVACHPRGRRRRWPARHLSGR
jgi:uncharacterized membrane protein YeaQ/YmgE (transglycosylase-associated protein family)